MRACEVAACLDNMWLLVDTREQQTEQARARIESTGLLHVRQKLNCGDYSCACELPDGSTLSMADRVAIERKMNIDELALCFGKERGRFEREFERAKEAGTKIYLLVEGATWEKIYAGKYRSMVSPKALIGSINAFRARYGMQLDFCKAETTGKVIRDILKKELKEVLMNGSFGDQTPNPYAGVSEPVRAEGEP